MVWYPGKKIGGRIMDNRRNRDRIAQGPTYGQDPNVPPVSPLAGQARDIRDAGTSALGTGLAGQTQALGDYQAMARGEGPSLAQAQLQQATQQNVANQMSMAAQGRGGNLAAQQSQAMGAGAAAQMGAQQQAAQIRAQEQLAAMQGAAGLSGQIAQQGLQQQLSGAGMGLQAQGQANQYGLGQRGLDMEQLKLLQQQQQANRGFGLALGEMGIGAIKSGIGLGL